MAFEPTSTIVLCNVPFDGSYKHQVLLNKDVRQNYFQNRAVDTLSFDNYTVVRKNKGDGGVASSVMVERNIDDLYKANYLYYQNKNHGTRIFYCFITDLKYVNEDTTEIFFETDVYQTWWDDVTFLPSFIEREHSPSDGVGDNIVPEPFNYQDYEYEELTPNNVATEELANLSEWGYLLIASDGESRVPQSGIYQGMTFYYAKTYQELNDIIDTFDVDNILMCLCIPQFNVSISPIRDTKILNRTDIPAELAIGISVPYDNNVGLPLRFKQMVNGGSEYSSDASDYFTPKNKKVFTAPFTKLVVSNNSGETAEYAIEDFIIDRGTVWFTMYGDVSTNPTITLVPRNYKGINKNVDCSISLAGLPQCSLNIDAYKLWVAKNTGSMAIQIGTGIAETVAGVALMATGAGSLVGGGMALHGSTQIAGAINSHYQATKEPNKSNVGSPKNNLLTCMKENKFVYKLQYIKVEYMKVLDQYFTMYGYQTNAVKLPNFNSRKSFYYVKTIGANIVGAIPNNDLLKLKSLFDNGITIWRDTNNVGNYNVDNSPTGA